MLRHCDGSDAFLSVAIDNETGKKIEPNQNIPMESYHYRPCSCGKTFDDVLRLTVWPHRYV